MDKTEIIRITMHMLSNRIRINYVKLNSYYKRNANSFIVIFHIKLLTK